MNPAKNHLEGQTSPYLIQHLYNPVDWYPWGPQALERARFENKPLLISIGYSACHWCHVMEKESFEDHEIAGLMNEHFICIKVDREERPDIDHIYMNAVQMISGRGGWPLNCFALPDGRPFWGGTYFPKDQWSNILNRVAEIFQTQRGDLEEQAEQLTQGISASSLLQPDDQSAKLHFPEIVSNTMANAILAKIDMEEGGMHGAPKFPLPAVFEFLLHYYHQKKDSAVWSAILLSLQKMAMGGIFDQVGGGFARYATDAKWKIPHFEKMLYDNAQLISLYAKAWMVEPDPIFRQTVEHTLSFVQDELLSPAGTFYSALDADSEGAEGKFYVWQEKEFRQLLGQEADMAARYYSIGKDGYWENGNNILLRSQMDEDFAKDENLTPEELHHKTLAWKKTLKHARDKRIRPDLDNKVLISWNGLMITALTDAYRAFGDNTYKERAVKATQVILKNALTEQGQLFHTLTHDKPAIDGFLEDYASMTQALIALYQVTFEVDYLQKAKLLAEYVLENFSWTDTRMFSFSSSKGEKLIARYHDYQDNVIPSANSIMARSLFYLGHFYENNLWVERSLQMLHNMKPQLEQNGSWTANWGILWLHQQKPFYTFALCGHLAEEQARRLANIFLPDTILCAGNQPEGLVPLLMSERFVENKTLIYPCTFEACGNPAQNPEQLLQELFG